MSNRELPMMPWFPQDFASATAAWTFAERSLYRELLDAQWVLGRLPTQPERLARIAKMDLDAFKEAWPMVSTKFEDVSGCLYNKRLEDHRTGAKRRVEQSRSAARASAEARAQRAHERAHEPAPSERRAAAAVPFQHPSPSPSPVERREEPPPPTSGGVDKSRGRRINGTHARATAENPRAAGTNPRAKASNPRAERAAEKAATAVPIGQVLADAAVWAPLVKRGRLAGFRPARDGETADAYETALKAHEAGRAHA